MSSRTIAPRRSRRRLLAPLGALILLAAVLALMLGGGNETRAAFAPTPPVPQTDDSLPANDVLMIGASAEEAGAPGSEETWGIGTRGSSTEDTVLVRYTAEQGWVRGPSLPQGFKLAADGLRSAVITQHGAGALLGTVAKREVLLTRSPGGAFLETAPVPSEAEESSGQPLLGKEEALFAGGRAPLLAALDEPGRRRRRVAGARVERQRRSRAPGAPLGRNPLEQRANRTPGGDRRSFRVLAISRRARRRTHGCSASSRTGGYPEGAVALFRRIEEAGTWRWKPVALQAAGGDGEAHPLYVPLTQGEQAPFEVHGERSAADRRRPAADGDRAKASGSTGPGATSTGCNASTTLYFKPEGSDGGTIEASWCLPPPLDPERVHARTAAGAASYDVAQHGVAGRGPYGSAS